uniref:Putative transposase n=1 Tax=Ixodes ricinus TaxID=34613 RepID=A0A6B0UTJ7_IXORI
MPKKQSSSSSALIFWSLMLLSISSSSSRDMFTFMSIVVPFFLPLLMVPVMVTYRSPLPDLSEDRSLVLDNSPSVLPLSVVWDRSVVHWSGSHSSGTWSSWNSTEALRCGLKGQTAAALSCSGVLSGVPATLGDLA